VEGALFSVDDQVAHLSVRERSSMSKWKLFIFTFSLALAFSAAGWLVPHGLAQSIGQPDVTAKIDRWIIDQTIAGAQAEFLIVLSVQSDLAPARQLRAKSDKGRFVYATRYATAQATQRPIVAWLAQRAIPYRSFYIVNAIWVKADRDTALALAARSDVARLDGNPAIYNEPLKPAAAGLQLNRTETVEPGIAYVHAPAVWALGYRGQGVVVGGQDTGYLWDHSALKSQYRGWNGITVTHDHNWHDSIFTNLHGYNSCGAQAAAPCDDNGHGTHTMGTVLGDDGAGNQVGMAPDAQWIACRNMDNGWGTPATYLGCFEFFLAPYPVGGTTGQGDPGKAPDVTNNSWSCPDYEGCAANTLLEAVRTQRAAGIFSVAAATNDGPTCGSIAEAAAIYAESYTVGALNMDADTIAGFSSRGPVLSDGSGRRKPDIAAPGVTIRSATRDGGYGWSSGTSMAAPHVAGAVALLWSAHPAYKNQITLTEQLLNASAVHLNATACDSAGWPNNVFGYGRLDVLGAVTRVVTATQWARSGQLVTYSLRITNTADTTDTLSFVSGDSRWPTTITPTTQELPPAQSALLTVTVAIPANAAAHETDAVAVAAASSLSITHWIFAALTTRAVAADYDVELASEIATQNVFLERTITYTLNLVNTGGLTDTYHLSTTFNSWAAHVIPVSITVAPQAAIPIFASVTAPLTAAYGLTDSLRVTATSANSSAFQDLISQNVLLRIFFPLFPIQDPPMRPDP
jgi:serine protease AprX